MRHLESEKRGLPQRIQTLEEQAASMRALGVANKDRRMLAAADAVDHQAQMLRDRQTEIDARTAEIKGEPAPEPPPAPLPPEESRRLSNESAYLAAEIPKAKRDLKAAETDYRYDGNVEKVKLARQRVEDLTNRQAEVKARQAELKGAGPEASTAAASGDVMTPEQRKDELRGLTERAGQITREIAKQNGAVKISQRYLNDPDPGTRASAQHSIGVVQRKIAELEQERANLVARQKELRGKGPVRLQRPAEDASAATAPASPAPAATTAATEDAGHGSVLREDGTMERPDRTGHGHGHGHRRPQPLGEPGPPHPPGSRPPHHARPAHWQGRGGRKPGDQHGPRPGAR